MITLSPILCPQTGMLMYFTHVLISHCNFLSGQNMLV